jgi:hypothetical protein
VNDGRGDGGVEAGESGGRGVDGVAVPAVRKAKESAKRLRAVQPVRGELAGGRPSGCRPEKCALPGHVVFPNGAEGFYCLTCDKEQKA